MEISREDLERLAKAGKADEEDKEDSDSSGGEGGDPNAGAKPPAPTEYVYPEDYDVAEFRGKKASEVASMFRAVRGSAENLATQLKTRNEAPPPPREEKPAGPLFGKDDFIDPHASNVEEKITQLFQRTAAPLILDVYRANTVNAVLIARRELPHFQRFEQEIMAEVANEPINRTANFNFWREVHDKVAGRHAEEIGRDAAARASKERPAPPPSERGRGSGNAASNANAAVELTAEEKKMADGLGIPHKEWARMKPFFANEPAA